MLKESQQFLTEESFSSSMNDGQHTWWKKRSHLEKKLCTCTLFLMAVSLGMTASFIWIYLTYKQIIPDLSVAASAVPSTTTAKMTTTSFSMAASTDPSTTTTTTQHAHTNATPKPQEVCMSPGCIHAASDILQNMDLTKDPCVDFYDYACGGFEKKTYIDDDKTKAGQFSKLGKILDNQIKEIIQEDISPNDTKSITLAKEFYLSCMNKTQAEKDGLKPIDDIIELVGGWPVLEGEDWDDFGVTWQSLMYEFRKANLSHDYFIDLTIERDYRTGSRHILHLEEPSTALPRHYMLKGKNSSLVKLHLQYMIQTAVFYGVNESVATKDMEEVLEFEIKLAQLLPDPLDEENLTEIYNVMTVGELQKINPKVNWTEYISTLLPYNINESEPIVLTAMNYTKNFTKLLEETKPRVLANYVIGLIVRALTPYISEEFGQLRFDLLKDAIGVSQRPARWRRCLGQVSDYFDIAVGQVYIRKHFKPESKLKALEMVVYLTQEMDDILSNVSWADPLTIQRAKEKLANIHPHVAYPDELLSDEKVNAEYENVTIHRDTFFQNLMNYKMFVEHKYYAKLRKPVEKNSWKRAADVAVINAFYSSLDNSIILPAGILQEVFFSADRPQYMNFAAIGTVVGHELTHGFDNNGRQFDKNGHLKNWWEEETDKKFTELSECMVKQYDDFVSPNTGLHVDGRKTLSENIADNGGLKESYFAYQRWSAVKGINELPLPGLNMTTNQLFWMSYANLWCSKQRKSSERMALQLGGHTINRFRVNGPLTNMKPFAEDFQCKLGTPLNPEKRCNIW